MVLRGDKSLSRQEAQLTGTIRNKTKQKSPGLYFIQGGRYRVLTYPIRCQKFLLHSRYCSKVSVLSRKPLVFASKSILVFCSVCPITDHNITISLRCIYSLITFPPTPSPLFICPGFFSIAFGLDFKQFLGFETSKQQPYSVVINVRSVLARLTCRR